MGVNQVHTSLYYPCRNLVERLNKSIKYVLTLYNHNKQRRWDGDIALLNITLNSVPCDGTRKTPVMALLRRKVPRPLLSLSLETYGALIQNHKKISDKYNKSRVPWTFKLGDYVVCRWVTQGKREEFISAELDLA
ncbi:hypothetical protein PR048_007261 [Dryococelus australis]|uniref:Integrase catalytic domain-containing protein n=1 Tax=Dryococelus australis TaxID=614101 RepID=A0ABQ9ID54_9NEOP|nr:hypothetical protein PR048_007261 [Dryococelus australis]